MSNPRRPIFPRIEAGGACAQCRGLVSMLYKLPNGQAVCFSCWTRSWDTVETP